MTDRLSFVFYRDWHNMIKSQPRELKLALFDAIMNYAFEGIEPQESAIQLVFSLIKQRIDADCDKWEDKREKRRQAGRMGALKTNEMRWGTQQMSANSANADNSRQMSANSAKSAVNVNGNVNGNGNVNVNGSISSNEDNGERESNNARGALVLSFIESKCQNFAKLQPMTIQQAEWIFNSCTETQWKKLLTDLDDNPETPLKHRKQFKAYEHWYVERKRKGTL